MLKMFVLLEIDVCKKVPPKEFKKKENWSISFIVIKRKDYVDLIKTILYNKLY